MEERLKLLREKLKLSQAAFGESIGVKRSHVSLLESGARNITDRIISDVCRVFNVSDEWLRMGNGDMFIELPDDALDALVKRRNLDDTAKQMVKLFLELDDGEMRKALGYIERLLDEREEFADTISPHKAEIERARSILDAQTALDEKHNKGGQAAKPS